MSDDLVYKCRNRYVSLRFQFGSCGGDLGLKLGNNRNTGLLGDFRIFCT